MKQLVNNDAKYFMGMFASINCMHYQWKNCVVAWQGQFQDKDGCRNIILEAIINQSLWIWHAFFGLSGCNNDINVLNRSPLITNMLSCEFMGLNFSMNGFLYLRYYLLANGIYLKWSCFMQMIHESQSEKRFHFAMVQESKCKDVKKTFGVLQLGFAIIWNPFKHWNMAIIDDIMITSVIIDNMIFENENDTCLENLFELNNVFHLRQGFSFKDLMQGTMELESVRTCHSL
jgi:hypothetical protein